jgi:hypothetical protein
MFSQPQQILLNLLKHWVKANSWPWLTVMGTGLLIIDVLKTTNHQEFLNRNGSLAIANGDRRGRVLG